MKSFRLKDQPPTGGGGRNEPVHFQGQKRVNETHTSMTDPQLHLYKKGQGKESKLCLLSHVLMGNRSGIIVATQLTIAIGKARWEVACLMVEEVPSNIG